MHQTKRTPVFTIDRDGREIVLVPLANHNEPAKLFTEDWDRLMRAKISPHWTLNGANGFPYVRCGVRRAGRLDTVARLILRAGAGQVVGYCSEDRLNLRRDNLRIKPRSVGARSRGPASKPRSTVRRDSSVSNG